MKPGDHVRITDDLENVVIPEAVITKINDAAQVVFVEAISGEPWGPAGRLFAVPRDHIRPVVKPSPRLTKVLRETFGLRTIENNQAAATKLKQDPTSRPGSRLGWKIVKEFWSVVLVVLIIGAILA